ncbi:hypothetical protein GCK72_018619 [Caenorhabditis remanei]|uniref:Uncharacterized protein n=1 Tax=Caenorhabditis remanei TaxID=31234 RepID=A0A6A5GBT8_CAERE|nr:hypothetical protein GCK72_018619 [Caenorhabditis remanei]KAF1752065.1 hypothetical protein GCK72_018619 [Caenorhabditis remanei]
MTDECEMNSSKLNDRVGRRNDRKRDAQQANLPERSPSLRTETRQQRSHPYLPPRNGTHRQRPMIRPSSVVSMSGRSIAPSDCSENEDRHFDVDEEMEGMSLDSPLPVVELPPRPFPDKPYYWMNDYKTLEFIRTEFSSESYYVMHNGKIVEDFQAFINEYIGDGLVKYSFHLRIRGGKGGFGSLLRSFRVNKSTNKLMMRDLNGRRMASVDEEAKLKRYLEKQSRKEQELKEKRKAKLAKLTAGPAKHQFEDQEYLSRREEIIEKTEDACEAGFALMKEMRRKSRMSREQEVNKKADEEEDENAEDVADLFNDRGGRKRKIAAPTIGEDGDKKRIEDESDDGDDSENDSENEPDPEELEAIRKYFEEKNKSEKDDGEGTSSSFKPIEEEDQELELVKRPRLDSASNVDDLPKIDEKTPCEYGTIDLADFTSAEDLELLGLEHLKSALTDRGLKCGGSLSERAVRLWSVKGKEIREWPKSILTPKMKKKIAEEEDAERKAAKKKSKKNK